jgi:hypothetical protein
MEKITPADVRRRIYAAERCKAIRAEIKDAQKKLEKLRGKERPKASRERIGLDEVIAALKAERAKIQEPSWRLPK